MSFRMYRRDERLTMLHLAKKETPIGETSHEFGAVAVDSGGVHRTSAERPTA
jgi:hypothetical protein